VLDAVNWDTLTPAAAFVAGAVLATIAVLRVVRAVTAMFAGEVRRPRRQGARVERDHEDGTDTPTEP
jgi:hypothetical protein